MYVLVHGIGMSHRYFERLREQLSRDAVVWSLDLPGFGGMPKPKDSLHVREMATALGGVLDQLELSNVVVVGHSMGAQWVTELAIVRPDILSGVVAIGPVVDRRRRTLLQQAASLARESLGEPPTTNGIVFTDYCRCGPIWYFRQISHMLSYPIEQRLPRVRVPVLILRGEKDHVASLTWCRHLADCAADGALVVIPRARHVVQHTAPQVVARSLRRFVRRCEAGFR